MLFPRKLKTEMSPEEFIATFNEGTWTGGEFTIVETDVPLAPAYIIFESYDDPHFVTSVACFSKKRRVIYYVKAEVVDISSFAQSMTDSAIANTVGNIAGNVGLFAMSMASGAHKANRAAKKLAKITNKELVNFMNKRGI